jgi:uracil-DNA glycosylase
MALLKPRTLDQFNVRAVARPKIIEPKITDSIKSDSGSSSKVSGPSEKVRAIPEGHETSEKPSLVYVISDPNTPINESMSIIDVLRRQNFYGWNQMFLNQKENLNVVSQLVEKEKGNGNVVFPLKGDIFRIFGLQPQFVKVVIIGQDPYPTRLKDGPMAGYPAATGYSFSCRRGAKLQPSLVNIFTEVKRCYPDTFNMPTHGDLSKWVEQGVMLLNTCLTVNEGTPYSHKKVWDSFMIAVIDTIIQYNENVIWVLWGAKSRAFKSKLKKGTFLEAAHPSPQSVTGFINNGHFLQINDLLVKQGKTPIDWNLD